MAMKDAFPYVGMVSVQVLLTGLIIATKEAILTGMSNYAFILYTNAMASVILFLASFVIHRPRPPLNLWVVIHCFGLGLIGFCSQLIGFEGNKYAPAEFASVLFNIIPGLVFVLATLLRMEKVEWGSSSTLAKSVGIVVSISGAMFATLYQGKLLTHPSNLSQRQLFIPETNFFLGGSLFVLQCVFIAMFLIAQAVIVKKYSGELIILYLYLFFVTVISLVFSLVMEGENNSWSLQPTSRLVAVLFTGILSVPLQNAIILWCIKRKGPLFASMFLPVGVVTSAILGFILLGDPFYLGSLLGSIIIVTGLYLFLWGKAQEGITVDEDDLSSPESATGKIPLLQNHVV